MYVLDFLNKIKWDKREKLEDYTIVYFDRVEIKYKQISYRAIKRVEEPFIVVDSEFGEVSIPLHRIHEIRKKGEIVWKREI